MRGQRARICLSTSPLVLHGTRSIVLSIVFLASEIGAFVEVDAGNVGWPTTGRDARDRECRSVGYGVSLVHVIERIPNSTTALLWIATHWLHFRPRIVSRLAATIGRIALSSIHGLTLANRSEHRRSRNRRNRGRKSCRISTFPSLFRSVGRAYLPC